MKQALIIVCLLFVVGFPTRAWGAEESHEAGSQAEVSEAPHGGSVGEDGGGHESKSYFGIPGWLLKSINLIAFLGLLAWLLKVPLQRAFEDRRAGIQKRLADAEDRRLRADTMAGEIQKRLSDIEKEVSEIMARARDEGERQKKEIIAAAEEETKKILATANTQIDQRVRLARRELTEYAGVLAAEKAKRMIEEKITEDDQKRFFRESVEQIREMKS